MRPREMNVFKSKRNTVYREDDCVIKCFASSQDFDAESYIYDQLSGSSLAPKVIEKKQSCIVTEYIDGCLLFDALEQSLDDPSKQARLFELYFAWCRNFYELTALNLGDTNFRNFIIKEGRLYGVDFESCEQGSISKDIAWQCAMLATLRPEYSKERIHCARLFLTAAQKVFHPAPEELLFELALSFDQIGQRRNVTWNAPAFKLIQSTAEVSACALAGGMASRMGRDKKLMAFRNGTLISNALNSISLFDDCYLSVSGEGADLCFPNCKTVYDMEPGLGPLSGIVSTLKEASTPWVLFIPCDMPLLSAEMLDYLVSFREDRFDALFFTETGSARTFPLLLQKKTAAPIFRDALHHNCLALWKTMKEELRIREIPVEACPDYKPFSLKNINTPEDYASLQTICN